MLFTDPLFLFYFLPATLLLLRLVALGNRLTGACKICIIGATLVFYAYGNWLWVLLFLVVVTGPYFFGWMLVVAPSPGARRFWTALAIVHPLLFLGLFKYLNWLAGLFPALQPLQGWLAPWFGARNQIVLPPGISFYVFEAITYSVDLYRRKITPPRNPLDYLTFIAMFPRFIAGPIVRYADLETQIRNWAGMRLAQGLTLFAAGFSLKCLLADQFAVFCPYAFEVPRPDFLQAWIGVIGYSFQLYFDFWSYSIMATGLGLCLGFEFPDNFRSPYHAVSITQFWRRWHISLSTWLRDYLYIPLGGSRHGAVRTYANLLFTMLVGGIWHGANFTFAIWGFYHGVLLAVERALGESRLDPIPVWLRRLATLILLAIGWTIFRSENLHQALQILRGMTAANSFAGQFNPLLVEKNMFSAMLALSGVIFCVAGEPLLVRDRPLASLAFPSLTQVGLLALFVLALFVAASSAEIPFLYFQF